MKTTKTIVLVMILALTLVTSPACKRERSIDGVYELTAIADEDGKIYSIDQVTQVIEITATITIEGSKFTFYGVEDGEVLSFEATFTRIGNTLTLDNEDLYEESVTIVDNELTLLLDGGTLYFEKAD